jgi:uncharacterized Rossmann fold enzyme
MQFAEWEPIYRQIRTDFGYDTQGDKLARDLLASFSPFYSADSLDYTGKTVAIVGAAPTLEEHVTHVEDADCIIAASTAADVITSAGYRVDLMVTDLDKNPETVKCRTDRSKPVVVHAHGDNRSLLRTWLPRLDTEWVLPTTQCAPTETVHNFGGFTDGDRAAYLADTFGAERLVFVGWDFDDPTVSDIKSKKLAWADKLLTLLATRRQDSFDTL